VNDARTGTPPPAEPREKFDDLIARVLTGGEVDLRALIVRQAAAARPAYSAYSASASGRRSGLTTTPPTTAR